MTRLLFTLIVLLGNAAVADQSPVSLKVLAVYDQNGRKVSNPVEGQRTFLDLGLLAVKTGKALTTSDLVIAHEKLFHLYGYDLGLTNYVHIHPEPLKQNPAIWRVEVLFKQTGDYKLWSDITALPSSLGSPAVAGLRNRQSLLQGWKGYWNNGWGFVSRAFPGAILLMDRGFTAASQSAENPVNVKSMATLQVLGTSAPHKRPASLEPKFTGVDGISSIQLGQASDLKAGQMAMMTLQFGRTNGTKPQITPYLGALAHVVVTNLDGDRVMHVHPMQHHDTLMLHAEFPVAGDYRLFVQFIDGGILRTIELAVRVHP